MKIVTDIKLAIAVVALIWTQFTFANGVRGNPNCANWLQPENTAAELRNKSWLVGYLSGVNIGLATDQRRKPFDYFSNVTNDQLFLWMDNYCRANPLSSVMTGSANLFVELSNK